MSENLLNDQFPSKAGRSISYPAISLPAAVDRTAMLWAERKSAPIPVESAVRCWGYSHKSSGGHSTVAALVNFGLVDNIGFAEQRCIRVSNRAITIFESSDAAAKAQAIKDAATSPKVYSELINKWRNSCLPSDNELSCYLIYEKNFNPSSVNTFIKNYKETLYFADIHVQTHIVPNYLTHRDHNFSGINLNHELHGMNSASSILGLSTRSGLSSIPEMPSVPRIPEISHHEWFSPPQPPVTSLFKYDTFSLPQGQALLSWPANMSAESFEDFKQWLDLQIRKISRSITK